MLGFVFVAVVRLDNWIIIVMNVRRGVTFSCRRKPNAVTANQVSKYSVEQGEKWEESECNCFCFLN